MAFYAFYPPTNLVTATIVGPVSVTQGTSPWVVSGTVTANQGTSPWIVGGTVAATQSGPWSTGRTWTLLNTTDSVNAVQSGTWNIGTVSTITNPVTVNQGTSPWVVSGSTSTSNDTNYGTVGANTLRTAAQIGNATGAALFGAGVTTAQVLRVVLPTDQSPIPVTFPAFDPVDQGNAGLPGNAWYVRITDGATTVGITNFSLNTEITNAAGAAAVNIQDGGNSITVDGTVTANLGTIDGIATEVTLAKLTQTQGSTTSGQSGPLVQGAVTTAAPTYTTEQTSPLSLTTAGRLRIDGSGTTQPVSGTVAVTQSTSPWVVSGTVTANAGTGNFTVVQPTGTNLHAVIDSGTITTITNPVTVNQGTSPWVVSGTVTANQGTSPWVTSGTSTVSGTVTVSNLPTTVDTNYGTVGANTLRSAAQIGNATGAALFGAGTTTAQVLRVVLPTDQTVIPVQGQKTNNNAAPGATNVGVLPALANAAAPSWTEGNQVTLSTDLAGNTRVIDIADGSVAPGTAATKSSLAGSQYNSTPPTVTNTQQVALQGDTTGSLYVNTEGRKATYSSSFGGLLTGATNTTDIFTITGSATKVIRVLEITISGSRTTSADIDLLLLRRSTANSGGTGFPNVAVPHDTNNPAASTTSAVYSVSPTLGTLVGVIRLDKMFVNAPATGASDTIVWTFGSNPGQAIVLRGINQVLAVNLNGVTIAGGSFDIYVTWTEE